MFKLYKIADGTEVNFSTEEGMLKTLDAFPKKYKLSEDAAPDEIIDDAVIKEVDLDEEIKESDAE
jgi:hypothetical protein